MQHQTGGGRGKVMGLTKEQWMDAIEDIKMRFGALMGEGYKYQNFDEEEKEK